MDVNLRWQFDPEVCLSVKNANEMVAQCGIRSSGKVTILGAAQACRVMAPVAISCSFSVFVGLLLKSVLSPLRR